MSSGTPSNGPKNERPRGRFFDRRLRRASFISPITGERMKRNFTLREASNRLNDHVDTPTESSPLLGGGHDDGGEHVSTAGQSRLHQWRETCAEYAHDAWEFAISKEGLGILKCSLAYLVGSLATLVPAISTLIGPRQDSKHMVATVTVWFHPARSIGSMHEATVLALIAFCYSGIVSFTSMAVSMFFGQQDLLIVGHIIVLILFLGGGLGFIAWTKQYFGHPLVNVACSLASLGCITVLIKEGAVQAGAFSDDRVVQVLLMVIMGILATTAVNFLVLPVTARESLVKDLEKNTDLLGEMLISITRAFLSGSERDLTDEYYTTLSGEHQSSLNAMSKDLGEAKREHLVLGNERIYAAEEQLVDCLTGLAQDLGGLRSAAFAQFAFMKESISVAGSRATSPVRAATKPMPSILDVITEAPDESGESANGTPLANGNDSTRTLSPVRKTSLETPAIIQTPEDMFVAFLAQLGPPTKSLVYTLKQLLDELPFETRHNTKWKFLAWTGRDVRVAVDDDFRDNLQSAIDLYRSSRKEALQSLYASRALSAASSSQQGGKSTSFTGQKSKANGSPAKPSIDRAGGASEEVIADIEEVSACCGHFSFALLDFAEDMLSYLRRLEELKEAIQHRKRTWTWLFSWFLPEDEHESKDTANVRRRGDFNNHDEAYDAGQGIPSHIKQADNFADPARRDRSWNARLYRLLCVFRRDDIKFAVKVGLGALIYALPAFLASTRPFFVRWRGEWGLVSYMAVCSMTVGGSNTTSTNRVIGTFIGAALSIVAWVLASDHGYTNPWLLGFFGWLVSLGCFYLIVAKNNGPMGRFILLTYNLGALYSYSLSIKDDDHDDDEGGIDPAIWDIVMHRLVAVIAGCVWAIVVTRFIWPISARRKLKKGLCVLWLRMGLIWRRDPLAMFLLGEPRSNYMDIREESALRFFLSNLEGLRKAANGEFELRGPFPDQTVGRILERTGRMLDAFHAMNVVIVKNLQYTPGEAAVLRYTRSERFELSARISHLFSVLASSVKMEYPLNDVMPSIDHTRDRLLARISEFRRNGDGREVATEQDYELLYAYVLVTGQLSEDIRAVSAELQTMFGTLDEEKLKLQ
ncbi:hypothetical protein KC332_g16245 [Hortaea werneckii]|uniref:Integral membrane bound transporter domain-containing protein n=2 Tax=Hortaea werneckii TaxID=91943 RepID=A0A3M7I147_HORWE|nr:hypothetical protein KC358_g16575 [Hortaea werneckii]OTA22562.1 hypothetical protein BTJ68_14712 [Hortaea werneckii EXF-2000]KAI6798525.1 hypothetical protein KC350_g16317 [Hortaea werneckii]KAI6901770.1 hypothetical protein KC348_g16353 [Hortaea werneckii]KAI6920677.1 hypothetical protein KC341_g16451 [Hortaea werneckii]